ncbi:MAG: McrC family protein [Pseudobdellovibrionaceae bacterium]
MTIILKENQKQTLELTEEDISFLSNGPIESKFKIRRLVGGLGFEVTALNTVGALTLPSGKSLIIKSKLPLPNIFRMLSYVGELYKPLDNDVQYERDEELFDIIGSIFSQEMGRILRFGLKQNYFPQAESLRTIRGRIDFTQSIRSSESDRLFCRYSKLSLNTPLNRAMVKAAEVLLRSQAIKSETKKRVRSYLSHIPLDLVGRDFASSEFKKITLDRSTHYYQRIMFLSRLIIANAAYKDEAGENRFAGFLLDVSLLFEKYVSKALETENGKWELRVLSQNSTKLDVEKELTCRPDLTFVGPNGTCYIADTKYKDFSDLRFINEDVYQMVTYLLHHRCNEGFLVYPAFDPKRVGVVKTTHIPNGQGNFVIHGLCISLESPEEIIKQISPFLINGYKNGETSA